MSHNPRLTTKTTTLTRDPQGNPTQITAPNGQITYLSVDENNNLTEVRYEDNTHYTFSYYDGSLMDTMADPNGNAIYHHWNRVEGSGDANAIILQPQSKPTLK